MNKRLDKIKKLEEDLQKTLTAQKEMNEKYNQKIRQCRREIEDEQKKLEKENGELLLRVVKKFYGEVTEDTVEKVKELLDHNYGTDVSDNK